MIAHDADFITVAVTLDGVFGFIGLEQVGGDGNHNYLNLVNALTIGYETDGTPRFGFNQLPLDLMNPKHTTVTRIPRSNISYTVTCDADDKEHKAVRMYWEFFDKLNEITEEATVAIPEETPTDKA